MKIIRLDVIVVILLVMGGIPEQAYGCTFYGNGCSVPDEWSLGHKRTFHSACMKHDLCYHCGRTYGVSKRTCDVKFLSDMRRICSNWYCRFVAQTYYDAVRNLGGVFFNNSFDFECYRDERVRNCLSGL